jgi:nicotinate-nucleotide pyrophosphorylase (carboxylating)
MMDSFELEKLISNALMEDVGNGDHSTLSCIDKNARGKAVLKIKQEGVLAGVEVEGVLAAIWASMA